MKRFIIITVAASILATAITSGAAPSRKGQPQKKVTYITDMDCPKCVVKIKENVSFEKGVKDLEADLDTKTVRIVFNPEKTDTLKLGAAIRKLGYSASAVEYE